MLIHWNPRLTRYAQSIGRPPSSVIRFISTELNWYSSTASKSKFNQFCAVFFFFFCTVGILKTLVVMTTKHSNRVIKSKMLVNSVASALFVSASWNVQVTELDIKSCTS